MDLMNSRSSKSSHSRLVDSDWNPGDKWRGELISRGTRENIGARKGKVKFAMM